MRVKITADNNISNILCTDLSGNSKQVESEFDIEAQWYRLQITGDRRQIKDICIDNESIKMVLNSGTQYQNQFSIWIHGDLNILFERVFGCIDQPDLLRWQNLSKKYLATVSYNDVAPDFVPEHIKKFFADGQGPYWWNYDDKDSLPYRNVEIEIDKQKLMQSLNDDLTYTDEKFYDTANCRSLKKDPNLPLVPVDQIKNTYLRQFLVNAGYRSILQIQHVQMGPKSYIGMHRDDFKNNSGLIYIKGASQLYCVLEGDPNKFKLKFSKAGIIDVTKPVCINNNNFVHSLYYDGNEKRSTLLIYGN